MMYFPVYTATAMTRVGVTHKLQVLYLFLKLLYFQARGLMTLKERPYGTKFGIVVNAFYPNKYI